jgi:hypothetical protein
MVAMMKGCSRMRWMTLTASFRPFGEVHGVLEREDQRHRHRRLRPQHHQHHPRPHIADIAIGGAQPLDRAFPDLAARGDHGTGEHQEEHDQRRRKRAGDEAPFGHLLERRARHELKEQRRQRDIDDEDVEPAQRLDRQPGEARGDASEQDHAEERQQKGDDAGHGDPVAAPHGNMTGSGKRNRSRR